MSKLVIANWKSHKTLEFAQTWCADFSKEVSALTLTTVPVAVAAALPFVASLRSALPSQVTLAVQDVSPFPPGKYTGAVAAAQLAGLEVKYAIVGHSERRQYFGETNTDVANKVAQCLEHGITPVVCVDDEYVANQAAALEDGHAAKCVVAYEALSAIGTGKNMDAQHVAEITELIKQSFGQVPVLYGGSVTAANVAEYKDISDGWLVGSASLEVEDFVALVNTVAQF